MATERRVNEHLVTDLGDILAWAEDHGITFQGRFHSYKKTIESFLARGKEEKERAYSQMSGEDKISEFLSTMYESIELVKTIPVLRQHNVAIPTELLKKAFSGPVNAFREDETSNKARNAMFELSIGAMAAREGLNPVLSADNPDVTFQFEGRYVKVECKRVLSDIRIVDRLKEGINQLEKSVKLGLSDVGIVAISLSKVVNKGDRLLLSDSPRDDLQEQLRILTEANRRLLWSLRRPHVPAFIFYISSPVYAPYRSGSTQMATARLVSLNTTEDPFLMKLGKVLHA